MANRLETALLTLVLALLLGAPFGEGSATPRALFIAQSTIFIVLLLAMTLPSRRIRTGEPSARLLLAFAGFVALACVSACGTAYPYASFLRILDLFLYLALVLVLLLREWNDERKRLLVDGLLAAASLQALIVLLAAVRGVLGSQLANFGLLNPNHEAAFLLLALFVALPTLAEPGAHPLARPARVMGILLCAGALPLLGSRGALLGLLTGAGVMLSGGWGGRSGRAKLMGTAGVGLAVLMAGAGLAHRFGIAEDPYRYERIGIWRADLRCFAAHPLLGIGPGLFRHVAAAYNFPLPGPVRFARSFETPHSDFLGTLAEMGLVGLAAGLLTGLLLFKQLARMRAQGDRLAGGLLAACAAWGAQGLVEDLSTRPALMISMAILLGACFAGRQGVGESRHSGAETLRLKPARILFACLLGWVCLLNPYRSFLKDQAMRRSQTYAEMQENFRAAIRLNPYQAATYAFPARTFLATRPEVPLTADLYARFRVDLAESIAQDQLSADARIAMARLEVRAFRALFHDASSVRRAVQTYRKGIQRAPHDARIRVELAGFLHEVGRDAEALGEIDKALTEEPHYLTARLLRTRLLLEQGQNEQARTSWQAVQDTRRMLSSYRPDSSYAADISRDPALLREALAKDLAAHP